MKAKIVCEDCGLDVDVEIKTRLGGEPKPPVEVNFCPTCGSELDHDEEDEE